MTVPFFPHNLLRINDNLEVKENKLGPFTYYSIDNFFKEITHINNMLKYSYAPATMMPAWKNKTALSRNFKDYFDCRINLNLDQHGFEEENSTVNFLKNTFDIKGECGFVGFNLFSWINIPKQSVQFCPHIDPSINILIYLDQYSSGGTALYEGEINTEEKEAYDIKFDTEILKNKTHIIPAKFNRCVIFNGSIPHGGYIDNHKTYSNGNWRYNAVYFFKWQN